MKTLARSLSIVALIGLAADAHAQSVLSYFNFNSLPTSGAIDVTAVAPNIGSGSLESNFSTGIARANPGSTVNAENADPAGIALAMGNVNDINNGRYLQLNLSTEGFSGLTLSFAAARSSNGFNNNQFSYSTDGGEIFTNFGAPYDSPASVNYALRSFNLSTITALNDNSDVRFRIVFNGGNVGANFIDNLKVTAVVPAPSSIAVMALGGIAPLLTLTRRRRK